MTGYDAREHGKKEGGGKANGADKDEGDVGYDDPFIVKQIRGGRSFKAIAHDLVLASCGDLRDFVEVPERFGRAELGTVRVELDAASELELEAFGRTPSTVIINPSLPHFEAIAFFELLLDRSDCGCTDGNLLKPRFGAYLYGPPGVGKTHIMAAYARKLVAVLGDQVRTAEAMIAEEVKAAYTAYESRIETGDERPKKVYDVGAELSDVPSEERLPANEEFEREINRVRAMAARIPVRPTDVIYMPFDKFCNFFSSNALQVLEVIETCPVIFIDDIHPKNDPKRYEALFHLIERRYDNHLPLFLSSNLSHEKASGEDEEMQNRLRSRVGALFNCISFDGCTDYRQLKEQKLVELVSKRMKGVAEELLAKSQKAQCISLGEYLDSQRETLPDFGVEPGGN